MPENQKHLPSCPNAIPMTSPLVPCDCGMWKLERRPETPEFDKWTGDVHGTPDFRQIARDVFMDDEYGISPIAAIEEQLRLVWNARGAADAEALRSLQRYDLEGYDGDNKAERMLPLADGDYIKWADVEKLIGELSK